MDIKINNEIVKLFFNELAAKYSNNFNSITMKAILNDINLSENDVVAEVGSGTSDFTPYLFTQLGDKGKIYCIDIAEKMIEIAKNKINDPRVNFIIDDISNLQLDTFKINAIICFNMYPHVVNKQKFIKQCYSELPLGGTLVICHNRTREQISESHQRHGANPQISEFPETRDTLNLMSESNFKVEKVIETPYYLIKSNK